MRIYKFIYHYVYYFKCTKLESFFEYRFWAHKLVCRFLNPSGCVAPIFTSNNKEKERESKNQKTDNMTYKLYEKIIIIKS